MSPTPSKTAGAVLGSDVTIYARDAAIAQRWSVLQGALVFAPTGAIFIIGSESVMATGEIRALTFCQTSIITFRARLTAAWLNVS